MIDEDLLQYLWHTKQFDLKNLISTDGRPLQLIDSGTLNTNAGPDFLDARIHIGDMYWVGNVEIHVKASDWYRHGHEKDPAYNTVILHVVYDSDKAVTDYQDQPIPCLELKNRLSPIQLSKYRQFRLERNRIPCAGSIARAGSLIRAKAIEKALIQRLEKKTQQIDRYLKWTQHHWDFSLILSLARNFGTNINAEPFERLMQSIPVSVYYRERVDRSNLEALLFGQAGFLQANLTDDYSLDLLARYSYQLKKYKLVPIQPSSWRFMRTRPGNFPEKRIAQLAALLYSTEKMFDFFLHGLYNSPLQQHFDIELPEYWIMHYRLGLRGRVSGNGMTRKFREHLIINAIIPFYFTYGLHTQDTGLRNRLLEILNDIPPEKNRVTDSWKEYGFILESAHDTQGLIELKSGFCEKHKCLQCPIGHELMKN